MDKNERMLLYFTLICYVIIAIAAVMDMWFLNVFPLAALLAIGFGLEILVKRGSTEWAAKISVANGKEYRTVKGSIQIPMFIGMFAGIICMLFTLDIW